VATDIKKMLGEYMLAWNSHDVDKILSFFTDDGIYEDVALGIVKHGKKEIVEFTNSMLLDSPDVKFELKSVFGTGDWVGSEWVMSATFVHSSIPTMPATGKTFSIRCASILQLRKGKISRETDYYNMVTFLQQVGLMPGQPK
jgi:steroid delta-isomerase-like uncharacterized protein